MDVWLLPLAYDTAQHGAWWPDSILGRTWIMFGFGAQAVFAARFLVQWLASERAGKSIVPIAFWYLSMAGGIMLLAYAVFWKQDAVTALGQSTGMVVYFRNLVLIKKERERENPLAS